MLTLDPDARYSSADVAHWLGHRVEWFYANRAQLERDEGFPGPISRIGRPRWLGARLLEWERRRENPPPQTATGPVIVDYSGLLRERAAKVAGGKRA
jgi:hypothetical protein